MTFIHLGPPGKDKGSEFDRLVGQLHGAAPARRNLAHEFAEWRHKRRAAHLVLSLERDLWQRPRLDAVPPRPMRRRETLALVALHLYLGITVVVLVIDLVKNARGR